MAFWTGWIAVLLLIVAGAIPLGARITRGKRAAPSSAPIRRHVLLGLATSAFAFLHVMAILPALGSPAAAGGGMAAMVPAGAAFFFLIAHAGLGLQLRDEKLRDRIKKRRTHALTAMLILVAVSLHVLALENAR